MTRLIQYQDKAGRVYFRGHDADAEREREDRAALIALLGVVALCAVIFTGSLIWMLCNLPVK